MRNIFIVSMLLGVVFFLVGCKSEDVPTHQAQSEVFLEGKIEKMPVPIEGLDASHVLISFNKERFYLRSLLFDLDSYLEAEIRVAGVLSEISLESGVLNVFTVNRIDLLSEKKTEVELVNFVSEKFGISFPYDKLSYIVLDAKNSILIKDNLSSFQVVINLVPLNAELDLRLFIADKYASENFRESRVGTKAVYKNNIENASKLVYLVEAKDVLYEFVFNYYEDGVMAESFAEELLEAVVFLPLDLKVESVEEEVEHNLASEERVSESSLDSKFLKIIADFVPKAKQYLQDYKSPISIALTDDYFYFVYITQNDEQKRVLLKASDYSIVATFRKGSSVDWELVSGNNIMAEAELVLVNLESAKREPIKLVSGYRYFESLGLGFGVQYPKAWFYARRDNSYYFLDRPLEDSLDSLVQVKLLDVSFAQAAGKVVSTGMKEASVGGTVTYNIELGNKIVEVSGAREYSEIVKTMAGTVEVLEKTD